MAKRTTDSKIVPQCANCCLPDYSEGYCTAFLDPAYQWRKGECWGKCASAEEMVRRLRETIDVNEKRGEDPDVIDRLRREMEGWQETARLLRGGEIA